MSEEQLRDQHSFGKNIEGKEQPPNVPVAAALDPLKVSNRPSVNGKFFPLLGREIPLLKLPDGAITNPGPNVLEPKYAAPPYFDVFAILDEKKAEALPSTPSMSKEKRGIFVRFLLWIVGLIERKKLVNPTPVKPEVHQSAGGVKVGLQAFRMSEGFKAIGRNPKTT